jgi:hypothetical protein
MRARHPAAVAMGAPNALLIASSNGYKKIAPLGSSPSGAFLLLQAKGKI